MTMKTQTLKNSALRILTLTSAVALLAACQTTGAPGTPQAERADKIESAVKRAETGTQKKDLRRFSLNQLEQAYKKDSSNAEAAADYAAKLRESDQLEQAELILAPFANDAKSPAFTKTEYAAIQLALGNNAGAEEYGKKAVLQDPEDSKAYHYLGVALDSRGSHKEAERAFRKALDFWEGDPTPIMNNLALNLAAQEQIDEALEILEKAKTLAPDRLEIERNLRIVRALKQSSGYEAPKPTAKPEKAS